VRKTVKIIFFQINFSSSLLFGLKTTHAFIEKLKIIFITSYFSHFGWRINIVCVRLRVYSVSMDEHAWARIILSVPTMRCASLFS